MAIRLLPLLALLLAGVEQSAAQGLPSAVGAEADVGQTISGVPCRLRLVHALNDVEHYRIFCEGWDQPVARAFREPRRRWTMESVQKENRWITTLLEYLADCAEPQAKRVLGDIEGSVRSCTLKEGGWPYLALAAMPEKLVALADGPPDALPAIENALALMAGRQAASSGRTGQGLSEYNLRLYESLLGGSGRPPAIAANQQFNALRRLGLEYNYARDFSSAEQAYARALAMHEATFGVDHPGAADTISHLALNIGAQRRFAEADRLYARADALLKITRDPADTRRYLALRAFTESRRGNTAEAKRFADESLKMATQAEGQAARGGRGQRLAISQFAVMTVYARLGDHAQAEKVAREALENFQSELGRYHFWTSLTTSMIAMQQVRQGGRLTDAEKLARDGAQIAELLYGDGLLAVEANIRLGYVLLGARKPEEGLAAMRKAKAMALANRKSRAGLRADHVEPYVDALLASAKASPANAAAFLDEAFQALQLPIDHVVARAMTQMSARLSTSDSAVREVARQLQDAQEEVGRLRQRLAGLADREKRDAGQEQALAGRIEAATQRRDGLERQLQAANPRYAALRICELIDFSDDRRVASA
jgi:polyhydroxyalkanoate synthesis regulator phasin